MLTRRALAFALAATLSLPTVAMALDPIFEDGQGLAIRGADPVAYFTDGEYVPGTAEFTLEWKGATWRFASADHRAKFEAHPDRYAPKYGGYCAYAVSQGRTASIDPEAWTIVDDALYLNYSKDIQKRWLAKRDAYIRQADANWPGLRDAKE